MNETLLIKLKELKFRPREGGETNADIADFEKTYGAELPSDYRAYLLEFGGGYLDNCEMNCCEPTPFGAMNIVRLGSLAAVYRLLDSDIVPPEFIVIGHGHFGMETCLSLGAEDFGSIYAFDTEQRRNWTSKALAKMPHLLREIKEFFNLRDQGLLAVKEAGHEHCYLVAQSFTEFIAGLQLVTPT